ncbi:hypothetical protein NIES4074_09210 [Cylindrospermum sp. NIES-4074]|nr:hypothetical protein NIES4074_09210 [Cylindrospermum sp. NIES-4074]
MAIALPTLRNGDRFLNVVVRSMIVIAQEWDKLVRPQESFTIKMNHV